MGRLSEEAKSIEAARARWWQRRLFLFSGSTAALVFGTFFMSGIALGGGSAELRDGVHYLVDHGDYTQVTVCTFVYMRVLGICALFSVPIAGIGLLSAKSARAAADAQRNVDRPPPSPPASVAVGGSDGTFVLTVSTRERSAAFLRFPVFWLMGALPVTAGFTWYRLTYEGTIGCGRVAALYLTVFLVSSVLGVLCREYTVMYFCGKLVLTIHENQGSLVTRIGPFRFERQFKWSRVTDISIIPTPDGRDVHVTLWASKVEVIKLGPFVRIPLDERPEYIQQQLLSLTDSRVSEESDISRE